MQTAHTTVNAPANGKDTLYDKKVAVSANTYTSGYDRTIDISMVVARAPAYSGGTIAKGADSAGGTFTVEQATAVRDALTKALDSAAPTVPEMDGTGPVAKKARPHGPQEYRGNGNHDWEVVCGDPLVRGEKVTRRLRVPGGWLYRYSHGTQLAFVPVPDVVGYDI